MLASPAMLGEDMVAEFAYTAAEVAQYVFVAAGDDLEAASVAAEGTAHRKGQRMVDEGVDRLRRLERPPARCEQRLADLPAHRPLPQRGRQRASGPPETHPQRSRRLGLDARHRRRLGLYRRLPGSARFLDPREDRDELRETADREDLVYHCVETGDREPPLGLL